MSFILIQIFELWTKKKRRKKTKSDAEQYRLQRAYMTEYKGEEESQKVLQRSVRRQTMRSKNTWLKEE